MIDFASTKMLDFTFFYYLHRLHVKSKRCKQCTRKDKDKTNTIKIYFSKTKSTGGRRWKLNRCWTLLYLKIISLFWWCAFTASSFSWFECGNDEIIKIRRTLFSLFRAYFDYHVVNKTRAVVSHKHSYWNPFKNFLIQNIIIIYLCIW